MTRPIHAALVLLILSTVLYARRRPRPVAWRVERRRRLAEELAEVGV